MKKKYLVLDQKGQEKPGVVEKEINKSEPTNNNSQIADLTGIGFGIALPMAGGALLGSFLDKAFSTAPRLTLGLIIIGIILGISNLFFLLKKMEDK